MRQLLRRQADERKIEEVADPFEDLAGKADPAGFGQRLDPADHVHRLAGDIPS